MLSLALYSTLPSIFSLSKIGNAALATRERASRLMVRASAVQAPLDCGRLCLPSGSVEMGMGMSLALPTTEADMALYD